MIEIFVARSTTTTTQMHVVDNSIAQRFSARLRRRVRILICIFFIYTYTHIHSSRVAKHYSLDAAIIPFCRILEIFMSRYVRPFCSNSRRPLSGSRDRAESVFVVYARAATIVFQSPSPRKTRSPIYRNPAVTGQRCNVHTGFIIIRIPSTIRSRDSRTDSFVNDHFLYQHHEIREFRSRDISLSLSPSLSFSLRVQLHLLY